MAVKALFSYAFGQSEWYPMRNDDAENEKMLLCSPLPASAPLFLSDNWNRDSFMESISVWYDSFKFVIQFCLWW